MDKQSMYTAQAMRERAEREERSWGDFSTGAMLRQAADAEDELAKLSESKNRWMQYQETAAGERNACIDELRKKDAEIAQLKARLEAVMKIAAPIIPLMKMEYDNHKCSPSAVRCGTVYAVEVEKILRAARGEESAPQ